MSIISNVQLPADPTFGCTYAPPVDDGNVIIGRPGDTNLFQRALTPQLPLASLPAGLTVDHLIYPYLVYVLDTTYKWINGVLPIPVSPSDDAVAAGASSTPPIQPDASQSGSALLSSWGIDNSDLTSGVSPPQYGGPLPSVATLQNIMSDRTPCVQIPVTAPYGLRIVRFLSVRMGTQPDLPDPTPPSDNEALLCCIYKMSAPQWLPDGYTPIYAVAGIYAYSCARPYWGSDGLVGGSSPTDNTSLITNFYDPSGFDPALA